MKKKVILMCALVVILLLAALVLFDMSPAISASTGIARQYIDAAALLLAGAAVIPSAFAAYFKEGKA